MMLARVLAAHGDLAGCTRELHQVPQWWPQKAEALFREGQAHLLMNRARDAEAALLAAIGADLLHPADPAVFHDASQELLSLYATENRWDDAHVILWKIYDRATPAYRPTVLAMRIQSRARADRPDRVGQAALALRGRRPRRLGGTASPGQRRAGAGPARRGPPRHARLPGCPARRPPRLARLPDHAPAAGGDGRL